MAGKKRERGQQHAQPFLAEEARASKKKPRAPKQHQKEERLISTGMSSKILKEALLQQKEIEDDEAEKQDNAFTAIDDDRNEDLSDSDDDDVDALGAFSGTHSDYVVGNDAEVDEEEERILESFMSKDAAPQRTLADIILAKIRKRDEEGSSEARSVPKMDTAVIDVYKGVGKLLSTYTVGKVPKAIKTIPSLELWEDVLYLTEPEKWSPHALGVATKIFASNMGSKKAQRFYSLVLLPRIREDIRKNKNLHFALYQALKKSLYKPGAFNKGILFPLCESGTCSLREAVIVGSVIEKISIPPLHSSVALLMLAQMEYCGTTSYFIKLLLNKKYALPYRVLDAVVAHFMRFLNDTRVMPVIWHQSLLTFIQRYKNELTKEDKAKIYHLIEYQKHYLVTSEIKRELQNSRNRGEKEDPMSITSPVTVVNKAIEEDRFDFPDVPMEEE